jgi:hypothetical protein
MPAPVYVDPRKIVLNNLITQINNQIAALNVQLADYQKALAAIVG